MPNFESVVCPIPSMISLWIGAEVIVNLTVTEGYLAKDFKEQFNGHIARVVDFEPVYVGPLDSSGRLPGVYPGERVCIKLSNGLKRWVHPHMLILNEMATTRAMSQLSAVEPQPLPRAIRYYPGDVVRRRSDPQKERRTITHVNIEQTSGEVLYYLSEAEAEKRKREERLAEHREKREIGLGLANLGMSQTERSDAASLWLVSRGNAYRLYHSPKKLRFKSDEEALAFWAQSGVSRIVGCRDSLSRDRIDWTIEDARAALARGEGDLITKPEHLRSYIDLKGDYLLHRLHDCFAAHRDQVSALMARLKEVPSNRQSILHAPSLARKVIGIN